MNTRMPHYRHRTRHGFTLIELLTVIAIIGILAGILIPTISTAQKKARESKTRIQLQNLVSICEFYHNEYHTWPTLSTQPVTTSDTPFELKANAPRFVHIMTGHPDQGDTQFNKHGTEFASFKDGDLTDDPNTVTPKDAFGNDDLWLVFNTNAADQHHISPDIVNKVSLTTVDGIQFSINQDPNLPINADCVALSPGAGVSPTDIITTWEVKAPAGSADGSP
ncbi:MAG TPA: prepilin-type N-terminal cleavage/methylation domain-containing protein [Opitutales bacterium]|nr:prepilin-type N-terminal cleavage/methylation domain-containing protein [Opitutales bacterium]